MKLTFPEGFLWGTSTSALQIESAGNHDWRGLKAKDSSILYKNIEHDLRRNEDAEIIASLGNAYRFSPDWSKLQREPKGELETKVIDGYRNFMGTLKDRGIHLMFVLHHFANPDWFVNVGSWTAEESAELFRDYSKKVASAFGDLVDSWNTINEPGLYIDYGYLSGNFPPYKKARLISALKVLNNMSTAHNLAYDEIKEKYDRPVGISNDTMNFHAESLLGKILARTADWTKLDYVPDKFKKVDFVGLSYYGRIPFRPGPITEVNTPGIFDELGRPHDNIWEYYPEGLRDMLIRFEKKYRKPIIITENGCCTDDDDQRIQSIKDHLKAAHDAIKSGVNLKGYFHWSTFDNFELHLGLSYRFGLVGVDSKTLERKPKGSALFYEIIAKNNFLEII